MPEPVTTIGGAAIVAYIGKDGLNKLLGPTAEYLGHELQYMVEKSHRNLGRIFAKSIKKLGGRINIQGAVNPRILKEVYEEGRFCEDGITSEYYSGILAASRGIDIEDNRGLSYLNTIRSMSSYEIKLHYIAYALFKLIFDGAEFKDYLSLDGRLKYLTARIGLMDFTMSMKLSSDSDIEVIGVHSVTGLVRKGVLADNSYYGRPIPEKSFEGALQLFPTLYGLELFLWANAINNIVPGELFKKEVKISYLDEVELPLIGDVEVPPGWLTALNLKPILP